MNINQAQRIAKELVNAGTHAGDIHFNISGPAGHIVCQWLDPHLGLFQRIGAEGFFRVADWEMFPNLSVESIECKSSATEEVETNSTKPLLADKSG